MGGFVGIAKKSMSLIFIVSIIVGLLIPFPPLFIDFLIAITIAMSVLVVMTAANITKWYDMKSFPAILLTFAMFRIMLNVSTTRKILDGGNPGNVVTAAGDFIIAGNIIIGIVMFIILIVFQFIVANGATRGAEVAARFKLDGLPGKQMSIDGEVQQGHLSPEDASKKRRNLEMEVDYYGSMDSAGKIIKGDVWIGITLTLVNIIFGLIIGVTQQGLEIAEAANMYLILTVGDGVVSQTNSLLMALAAGVVVTRVYDENQKDDLTQGIFRELMSNPLVLYILSAFVLVIGFVPGIPFGVFLFVALIFAGLGYSMQRKTEKDKVKEKLMEREEREEEMKKLKKKVEVKTEVEPIKLVLGYQLISLAETKTNGETLEDKIIFLRKNIAEELGVEIPQIHVVDDASLMPYTKYEIKVRENLAAFGELKVNKLLALKTPYVIEELNGEPTKDPVFKEDALWIEQGLSDSAKENGYHVLDPLGIISAHLNEIIRLHLHELLTRQQVKGLVDRISDNHSVLLEEIKDKEISLSVIQKVLQNLLRENITIKDMPMIIESIIDASEMSNKIDEITTIVRENIKKYICNYVKNVDGKVHYMLLDQNIERLADDIVFERHDGFHLNIGLKETELVQNIGLELEKARMADIFPVLLTQRTTLRFALSRLMNKHKLPVPVLSMNEIVTDVEFESFSTVGIKMDNEKDENAI